MPGQQVEGAAVNLLGTERATTRLTEYKGWFRLKASVEERVFRDWVVDGVPLRQIVAQRSGGPHAAGLPAEHPPLRRDDFWPGLAVSNLRNLLGDAPGDLSGGRVVLLYCPVCADISCGAVTAQVVVHDDVVEWRDLGWQDEDGFDVERDEFVEPLTFRFSRPAYCALLRRLLAEYRALADAVR